MLDSTFIQPEVGKQYQATHYNWPATDQVFEVRAIVDDKEIVYRYVGYAGDLQYNIVQMGTWRFWNEMGILSAVELKGI